MFLGSFGRPASLLVAVLAATAMLGCGARVIESAARGDDGGPGGHDDGDVANPACPSASMITSGSPCNVSGLTCPAAGTDCAGTVQGLECFCNGASWTCELAMAFDCVTPTNECPAATDIVSGGPCTVPSGQQCTSVNVPTNACGAPSSPMKGMCTCSNGGWECPEIPTFCDHPPPPPRCPAPNNVFAYQLCHGEGLSCAGNPQVCDGETFYDAFQCASGEWTPVATTLCASQAVEDAAVFGDASAGFDVNTP